MHMITSVVFANDACKYTDEESWRCQWPGTCSYCTQCQFCTEGPNGTLGGCGHCKFCGDIACPPRECVAGKAMNRNIKGRVLVLDVNSWWEHQGAERAAKITTAAQCEAFCKLTPFCNAWTFCLNPQGCDAGCTSTEAGSDGFVEFGPFGFCTGPLGSYVQSGAYPFQMCTLKSINATETPEYWNDSTDWVSGIVSNASSIDSSEEVGMLPTSGISESRSESVASTSSDSVVQSASSSSSSSTMSIKGSPG